MAKRYIGYFDTGKGQIETALLAEFDERRLKEEEKKHLAYWLEDGDESYKDVLLENVYPTIYCAIDYINDPKGEFYYKTGKLGDSWPVYCENVYKTYDEAVEAFCKGLSSTPEKSMIFGLFRQKK